MKKSKLLLLVVYVLILVCITGCATAPEESGVDVSAILDEAELERTMMPYCVLEHELGAKYQVPEYETDSLLYLTLCYARRNYVNPISAFLALSKEGLFMEREIWGDPLRIPHYDASENYMDLDRTYDWDRKDYPFTEAGAEELLADALTLSFSSSQKLELERRFLGPDGRLNGEMSYSWDEDCYYTYYQIESSCRAYVLCCYFRSADDRSITDVEFQLMSCSYFLDGMWAGCSLYFEDVRIDEFQQFAALASAVDHVMTGTTVSGEVVYSGKGDEEAIPMSYSLGEYDVTLEIRSFDDGQESVEWVELYNYRIQ